MSNKNTRGRKIVNEAMIFAFKVGLGGRKMETTGISTKQGFNGAES